jgi:hypothetical protein
MDATSKGSRLTPIRIGAALVVAAALSLGATSCGSDSSSDESASSASVVEKEAGFARGTYLKVVNKLGSDRREDPEDVTVQICATGEGCKDGQKISPGQSVDMANSSESTREDVEGNVVFADGTRFEFSAGNPNVGYPWIKTSNSSTGATLADEELVEPDKDPTFNTGGCSPCRDSFELWRPVTVGERMIPIWFQRTPDTDDSVMLTLQLGRVDACEATDTC